MTASASQPPDRSTTTVKLPRAVFEHSDSPDSPPMALWAFPPNRDTLGATAYLLQLTTGAESRNLLIDAPASDEATLNFLQAHGGVQDWVFTHRGGMGTQAKAMQQALGCDVWVQEQEAYLLPDLKVIPFGRHQALNEAIDLIWTPGHSPGSTCVSVAGWGGVLFSGRHLLPDRQGHPVPLRTAKTFHWWRQLQSVQILRDRFSIHTLHWICPGANTGFLRGKRAIDHAYEHLMNLDLDALRSRPPML